MYRTCIAIVDATRARLFTFDREADPSGARDELTEHTDFVNPARRLRTSELFSDTRTGSNRGGPGGSGVHYASDDHRAAHIDHMDVEFATAVAGEIARVVRDTAARRLVVCASPRMLGQLRDAGLPHDNLVVDELPRDLVKLTPAQLRDHLASYGLLPPPLPRPIVA